MIRDSTDVPQRTRIETDVCIVGAGMSGISIALALQGRGADIVLLEGGGEEPEDDTKSLTSGENAGMPYYPLEDARPRLLGGATNYWAGWCRPLDPVDLERRPWVPYSGWPIDWSELERYLPEAMELCQIDGASFDAADWSDVTPDVYRPPFADEPLDATVWVGSPPTKFGRVYRDRLARADDIRLFLHANVTQLVTDPTGEMVDEAVVRSLDGNRFTVAAQVFVLAAGALETPRILLNSRRADGKGLGNEHDVIGRYFMEHPHVVTGRVKLFDRGRTGRAQVPAVDRRFVAGAKARLAMERPKSGVKFAYTLREETLRERELQNWSAHLRTVSHLRGGPEVYHAMKLMVGNLRSARELLGQLRRGNLPRGVGKQVATLATHPDDVLRVVHQQLLRRPREFEIYTQAEQSPNPSSRVTLADEADALGVPRVRLEWRPSDDDKRSIRRAQRLLGERLEATGVGTVEPEPWLEDPDGGWGEELRGGFHHLGTARMGTDPRTSAVDPSCRLHGVHNLYVGDTSVFPTGGYANPLLTGAALALRTADIVHSELRSIVRATA